MKAEVKAWLPFRIRSQEDGEDELADLELIEIGTSFEERSIIPDICQLDNRWFSVDSTPSVLLLASWMLAATF